ncbi:perilipin-2 [Denticeps clupeoides]|nr:perilipin-2 [Denticeps clupeoides]
MEVVTPQNVVARVANLPLVSSTYDMMYTVYYNTKDRHPYIKSVCDAAELGVKTITSAALTGALPIIGKLEPQIAIANDLACKGLDKIEKTLPILHQPSGQIIANAKDAVTGAKDVMSETVNGAKDTVSHTLTGVIDRTRGAMQDSVEKSKAVVNEGVSSVMGSRVVRLMSSGMDSALSTSENLVEQFLPRTEQELEQEAKQVKGFDHATGSPSYYVRLGSLSNKLRQRAYQKAVVKVRDAKQRSQESISQLHHTVDLIEYAKKNIDGANQKVYDKFSSIVKKNGDHGENETEQIESRTLAIARNLTQSLQTTCQGLVLSLQGLPQNIQDQAMSISQSAMEIYTNFSKATAFGDLSDSVLASSKAQLIRIRESLDNVMDYLVNNTPLNWLVGPFYPRLEPATAPETPKCEGPEMSPNDLEMDPFDSVS